MSLTLATYNFLSGGSAARRGHWTRMLRRAPRPSLIFTQESRQPETAISAEDALFWRPVPGYRWGSGVMLRGLRAKEIAVLGFEGWVVGAELEMSTRVRAFSIHCPAGKHGYVRTMHELLDLLAPLRDDADLILAGDFNVAAGMRRPNEAVRFTRGERVLLERIRDEFDLIPCWQSRHPRKPLAQTLRWSANREAPYHCDGIFIPRSWLPRLMKCEVLDNEIWSQLSDHNPVIARVQNV